MDELLKKYKDLLYSGVESDKDGASIDKEFKKLRKIMEEQDIEGVKQALRANIDKWKNTMLYIAVTGRLGAGKSSFINALRGIKETDEGGAKIGYTETTAVLRRYKHPKNPNFIVWDMPGVGTWGFPKETYLERVKFDQFDFLMIVSNLRLTEEDLWLAKQAQERKKRFYFIRSKIDSAINDDRWDNEENHSPEKVLCTVRDDCYKNLMEAGIRFPKVFLVNNHHRESYDFGQLEAQLLEDSDSKRMESMALSLSTLTKEVLQKKRETLENRIWDKATEIAFAFSFSDQRKILEKEISYYMDQFDLDDKTLQDNKIILKLSEEDLNEFQTFVKTTYGKIAEELRDISPRLDFLAHIGRRMKLIYGLGLRESTPILKFSCLSLKQNLDEMYKMALHVYGVEAQKSLVQYVFTSGRKSNTK